MNYERIYQQLISRSNERKVEGYTENHHIVPKCLGGNDEKENICVLTPEEHYLAHQLLIRIYPNNESLIKAAFMMIPNRPSNKLYGWLKRRFSEVQSNAVHGDKNPNYGKFWITNGKQSKTIIKEEDIPEGWKRGKIQTVKVKAPNLKNFIAICFDCKEKDETLYWYKKLKESKLSLRRFVEEYNYPFSYQMFVRKCRRHIENFETHIGRSFGK